MTEKTFNFTWRLLMVLSVTLSLALVIFLEVTA
jgi:low affinity Fe/Cu permease